LQTYVTPEAHRGWHEWCATQGVTFSALLEAIGNELGANPDAPISEPIRTLIGDARRVDTERRRRTVSR